MFGYYVTGIDSTNGNDADIVHVLRNLKTGLIYIYILTKSPITNNYIGQTMSLTICVG